MDAKVLDFWQWASSDLVSNTLRGQLAEFLVASAVGIDEGVRCEWDAFDVQTVAGLRIEVKRLCPDDAQAATSSVVPSPASLEADQRIASSG